MDADEALQRLLRVSEDVRTVAVFDPGGQPVAATVADDEARELVALGDAMLAYAATLRANTAVDQVHAVTDAGDVYVVRRGERAVVAVTAQGSLAGLVQHDLRMLVDGLSRARRRRTANAVS